MKTKQLYLVLCILGTVLPLSQFVPWVIEHGLDIPLFVHELFSTRIGSFFGWDVIISAITLLVFIFVEGRRINMSNLWLPAVATLSVGVSLGLPLFLYLRQVHIDGEK